MPINLNILLNNVQLCLRNMETFFADYEVIRFGQIFSGFIGFDRLESY